MTKALEINIRKTNHKTIGLKIIHQCDRRIKRSCGSIAKLNGILFHSAGNIEIIEIPEHILYIRGGNKVMDNSEVFKEFSSSKECGEYIKKLSNAVDQLNQQLGE